MIDIGISISDAIGLVGAVSYLSSYALMTMKKIKGESYTYLGMNLIGATFVMFSLTQNWNLSSFIIQGTWILLSINGMYNIFKCRKIKAEADQYAYGQPTRLTIPEESLQSKEYLS